MTYDHLLYHAMPSVIEALKTAQRLAKDTGTDYDIGCINYALKMIDHHSIPDAPMPSQFYDMLELCGNE